MTTEHEGRVAEAAQVPSEQSSQPESAPISQTEFNPQQLVQKIGELEQQIEEQKKSSQSVKDRRIAKLENNFNELLEKYEGMKASGWTEDQAKYLMNLEQQLAGNPDTEISEVEAQAGPPPQTRLDYSQVFRDAGIDSNSPAAIAAAQQAGNDPVKLGMEIARLQYQTQQEPAPSPAGVATQGGQTLAPSPKEDDLIAEMTSLQSRVMRNDPDAIARTTEIRRELDRLSPMQEI